MKHLKRMTALLCVAGLTGAMSFAALAETGEKQLPPACFYGSVKDASEGRFTLERIVEGNLDEVIVLLTEETKILDAQNGYPIAELREGEAVKVYVGPAMTMSLPPMTNAKVVIAQISDDYVTPSYEIVEKFETGENGTHVVTGVSGESYTVNAETRLLPYLTRNMVYPENLQPGVSFLVWPSANDAKVAERIVIFQGENGGYAGEEAQGETLGKHGWEESEQGWKFYEQGTLKTGWLLDGGDWYYLNPETGLMQTGFLVLDGKIYYLKEDGRMLKEARTFTPDANGELK